MSQENEETPKAKKGLPKIVTYIAAGVLAAAVFGSGIFIGTKILGGSGDKKNESKKEEHAESAHTEEEEEEMPIRKLGVVVPMKDDLLFNPKDAPSRFVMIGIGIEVATEEDKAKVENELTIPINAAILRKLRSYTLDEIQSSNVQDSLPIILKKEIRPIFGEVKLKNVYISKFIIQ
ncbi:hypothetical protein MASR2M18_17820 [Ignavibacteria bacterium]|nr:flagellar basal body-associated FliL family protein [Bacteroidota bacterium]MCZ2133634.1 flagellar basal body-associated FliL family protein [Bacteroidota bacterium]